MKYLHIMTNDKFNAPYIEFLDENFDISEHFFIFLGGVDEKEIPIPKISNVKILPNKLLKKEKLFELSFELFKYFKNAEKIFLHGLFIQNIILFLYVNPWFLKKCNWLIWGGDLYYHQFRTKSFKSDIYEYFRKQVIKNIGYLTTHITGDYELAVKWYGAKGKYCKCFMYPSNLFKNYELNERMDDKKYVLIGNSANPSNNHEEVFKKLKKYKDEKFKIICPLSYGDREYAEKIKKMGEDLFGKNFIALMDLMPFEQYLGFLSNIDVAIFNHRRQQAMGTTITLLGMGIKVYLRSDTTTWRCLKENGINVFDSCEEFDDLFENLGGYLSENNINGVKNNFSENMLKEDWTKIFGG